MRESLQSGKETSERRNWIGQNNKHAINDISLTAERFNKSVVALPNWQYHSI